MTNRRARRLVDRSFALWEMSLVLAAVLTMTSSAWAQPRATISGTVSDRDGTRRAGVTVVVKERETGEERLAAVGPDGTFAVGGLLPGVYEVSVQEAGVGIEPIVVELAAGDQRQLALVPGSVEPPPTAEPAKPAETESPAVEPQAAAPPEEATGPDFIPTPDRWRLEFPIWQRYDPATAGEYPFVPGRGLDPYDQNALKGDLPVIGNDVFMNLTAVFEMPFEYRRLPTPSGVSTERPGSEEFFGRGEQVATLPTGVFSFELFRGDTAFRPRDWAIRVTPVVNMNYLATRERNVVNATPEEGNTRLRYDFALQEAFGEVKLFDVGANFDFVSIRAGIQPFTSDFRGFLFRDTNLGVRAFGNWGRNRNQWNVAYFDQLEKETNSELNLLERRDQRVIIANYYRQDFLTLGYTISPSFHANLDDGDEFFFDENGFLVRPAPIGLVRPHRIRAYYIGIGGDGHIGRLNLTHQFYQALGHDDLNGISGQRVDINAQFAAVELSIDKDWYRPKVSFLWASGDADPDDDEGRGFDAILDNPNFAGGPFSFWNRQGIRLTQTLVGLVGRSSVLPSLRSSKTEGQASFVNPGVFQYNVGFDAELTTKLRTSLNVNYLQFHHTDTLERVLFQSRISRSIGLDYSIGAQYRPWLNDNVVIGGGISVFAPGDGLKNLYSDKVLFTPFVVLTLTY